MSFTGLYFTSGGWIMFSILLFAVFAVICAAVIFGVLWRRTQDDFNNYGLWSSVFIICFLAGCLFVGICVSDGITNQRAYSDLTDQGYGVASIATSSDAAIIITDGVRLDIALYESPSTGRYTAYLLCPVGVSYSSGDSRCIATPDK